MVSLRSRLIRLAHSTPELRPDLLPLLKRSSHDLSRKGNKYSTSFYGDDDGTWEAYQGFKLGRGGWSWEMVPSLSSKNGWANFSVEGATEQHAGFVRALREIAIEYPEVLNFIVSFDGPYKPVKDLLGEVAGASLGHVKFLHGTSMKAWELIKHMGVQPRSKTNVAPAYGSTTSAGEGRRDGIYLTTQIGMAHFAALEAAKLQKSTPVVLAITGLDQDLFVGDEDSGETDPVKSLGRIGSVAYLGDIPARKVTLFEVMVDNAWEKQ